MNKETMELIDKIAEKLGTTSEYIMQVLINQAGIVVYREAIAIFILFVIFGTLVYCVLITCVDKDLKGDFKNFLVAFLVVGGMGSLFMIKESAYIITTALLNPEYWALSEIISKIK